MILQASWVPQWRCRERPTRGVHQRQPSPLRQGVRLPRQLLEADRRRRRLQFSYRGRRYCKRGHRHRRQPQQLQSHGFQSGAYCHEYDKWLLTDFLKAGQLLGALESKVKHAQCFDMALMKDGSIVLASKDYRLYIYRYVKVIAEESKKNYCIIVNYCTEISISSLDSLTALHISLPFAQVPGVGAV